MKKLFSTLAVVALTALSLNAQQIKEGYVLYDMKIEGMPAEQAAMMGDMETKITFKNGKSLTEVTSMMYTQQIAQDGSGGMLLLTEAMGNKTAVKMTKEDLDKEAEKSKDKNPEPKIEYINETKTIAGYECKKAIITMVDKKKETKSEIWYCEKFENQNKDGKGKGMGVVKGLKGMPFEFSGEQGPMKIKMVAKEVSIDPVADSKFELSTEGYKVMTMDEVKAMQGGK